MNIAMRLARIDHLNIRKAQDRAGERVLAVDLKISGRTSAESVADALSPGSPEIILAALWDDDGDARLLAVSEIWTWVEWADHTIAIGLGIEEPCSVKKLRLSPVGERMCDITLQASIAEPHDGVVQRLAEIMAEEVAITITGQPELDL